MAFEFPLSTPRYSPKLEAEVAEYAKKRHDTTKVSQESSETLHRLKEDASASVRQFKFDQQEELESVRIGKTMDCLDLLSRLNKLAPARFTAQKGKLLALKIRVPSDDGGEWRFVCAVPAGQMPEFSTLYIDNHGLPTSEMYRGWRTILLRAILAGCLSETAVEREFGRPDGPEGERYRRTLWGFRNRPHQ